MTRGLKVPIAFPHDGHTHDKGSGLPLAAQYKGFGANMMATHAVNHGTKQNNIEPALEDIREMMFSGKLTIAGHNAELIEEMRSYHRDEDYRVVKQRDDLVSALRYAVMMRRQGRTIGDESATACKKTKHVDCGQAIPGAQHDDQIAISDRKGIGQND